jgi:hypothetical protein
MNESCLSISGTKDTETKITKNEMKMEMGARPHCLPNPTSPWDKRGETRESMVQKNGDRQRKPKRRGTIN